MDSHYDDDEYYDDREPECHVCSDTEQVVAADGYHEYLGYDYIPCPACVGRVKPGDLPVRMPIEPPS